VSRFHVEDLWIVTMCSVLVEYQREDGGSKVLRNVGMLPQHYTASEPRRPRLQS